MLETAAGTTSTRFVVLNAKTLKVWRAFTPPGTWGYDAISPDGRSLFLIQILPADGIEYLVRAYDLRLRRLVKGASADGWQFVVRRYADDKALLTVPAPRKLSRTSSRSGCVTT